MIMTLPPDAVVVSSAVGPGNEEVDAAAAANVPIYKRDAWIGKLTEGYEVIAIAGTHGKSTTTAMLSVVLRSLGEDITAIVGAQVPQVFLRSISNIFSNVLVCLICASRTVMASRSIKLQL